MNQTINFLSENLVQATGWTLLHSLWQGALLALALGILLLVLHRHSSKTRYAVAGSALLLQVLLSTFTFDHYYTKPVPAIQAAVVTTAQTLAMGEVQATEVTFWQDPLAVAQVYFEQNLPLLVMLWLLGLLLMTLRFLGGLAYTQRLRHYKATPLADKWQQRLSALRQELGMSKAVRLVESGLVQVPMAIGYAKPVILLPVGAVTGLSQVQIEAILAHELAHILRRDYLFNILQSVVDILFFYHPAMWWISGQVRCERENCCDDIAVAVCGSNLTYARALAELEAMRMPSAPAFALAFSGKRGSLLGRIKRLVGQQSNRPTFKEGFAAALILAVGLFVFSCGTMNGVKTASASPEKSEATLQAGSADVAVEAELAEAAAAEEENNAFAFEAQDAAGPNRDVVIIKNKKGKVKELYVDGKRIPEKDIPAYNALVEQRLQAIEKAPKATAVEVNREIVLARHAAADAQRRQQESFNYRFRFNDNPQDSLGFAPVPPLPPMPPMPPMHAAMPMPPMPPAPPVAPFSDDKEGQKRYKEAMKQYEKEIKQHEEKIKAYEQEIEQLHGAGAEDRQRYQRQVQRYQEMAVRQTERSKEMALRHEEMAKKHEAMAKQHEERMQQLKKEMVKDGLLQKETDKIDIRITKDNLYVNGEKQSKEMFEKYKKLMDVKIEGEGNFNFQYNSN